MTDTPKRQMPKRKTPRPDPLPPGQDADLIGANVARLRLARDLTQSQLAQKMQALGHDSWRQNTVSRVENGSQGLRMGEVRTLNEMLCGNVLEGTAAMAKTSEIVARAVRSRWIGEMQAIRDDLASSLSRVDELLDELRDAEG